MDPGSWILDPGFWILDPGFWILDPGSWIRLHVCVFSVRQELVKHTHDATDKSNLRLALDAMKVPFPSMLSSAQVSRRERPLLARGGIGTQIRFKP